MKKSKKPKRRSAGVKIPLETWARFMEDLQLGMSLNKSAEDCAISHQSVYNRRKIDKKFDDDIRKAMTATYRAATAIIRKGMTKDPKWAAFMLTHRHRDEYHTKQEVEAEGSVVGRLFLAVPPVKARKMRDRAEALEKAGA